MISLFDRVFGRNRGTSDTAKERLKFLLIHDRMNLSPEKMKQMKIEILEVIARYVTLEGDSVYIAFQQVDHNTNKLVAEVPILKEFSDKVSIYEQGDDNADLEAEATETAETAEADE